MDEKENNTNTRARKPTPDLRFCPGCGYSDWPWNCPTACPAKQLIKRWAAGVDEARPDGRYIKPVTTADVKQTGGMPMSDEMVERIVSESESQLSHDCEVCELASELADERTHSQELQKQFNRLSEAAREYRRMIENPATNAEEYEDWQRFMEDADTALAVALGEVDNVN